MRNITRAFLATALIAVAACPASADFNVVFGTSWDSVPLQQILDDNYGVGAIDAATDYEGYLPGDADPPYWTDAGLDGLIVKEIAGYSNRNTMGWHEASDNVIDGVNDGVIFSGPMSEGETETVSFPAGVIDFGFYLDPNGDQDAGGAPQGEHFFANRFYNDAGVNHEPFDGDPQCLIYNITHLRGGVPTFVLAWEDLDYGQEISATPGSGKTDNDFNDLVCEITAISTVEDEKTSWGRVKALYGN